MTSLPRDKRPKLKLRRRDKLRGEPSNGAAVPRRDKSRTEQSNYAALPVTAFLLLLTAWFIQNAPPVKMGLHSDRASYVEYPEPLVMRGGNPYIRALMRTISASESNMDEPYRLLYGGTLVEDLSRHPDVCIEIVAGPNTGDCTTAAGRYQFLTTTWEAKAEAYHPNPPAWFDVWGEYSFQPEYQDAVVHSWLSDSSAWGVDIAKMLEQGRLDEVLYMLSGTWTSLGYGIETNSMSGYLPQIYNAMLEEELNQTGAVFPFYPGRS